MKQYINEIINKKYNTNNGYLYLIELINKRFPTFIIDYSKIENLVIKEMDFSYYEEYGVVAEYRVKKNEISLLRHNNSKDYSFSDDELIESFLHELIHALTSKINLDIIWEGLNQKKLETNENSLFVGLNEGITQYITNEILDIKSNAYPIETKFAKQIAIIVGDEKLIQYYSENNIESFINELKTIDPTLDERGFIESIFILHFFLRGFLSIQELLNLNVNFEQFGSDIQQKLIDMYKKSSINKDLQFYESLVNKEENKYYDLEQLGFKDFEKINARFKKDFKLERNGNMPENEVFENKKQMLISNAYRTAQEMVDFIKSGEVIKDVTDDNGERIIVTKTARGTYGYQVFERSAKEPHYYAEGSILIEDLKKNTDSDGRVLRYDSAKSRVQRNLVGYFYEYILDRGFHSFYLNIKMPKDSMTKVSQRMAGYDPQDPTVIIGCSFDQNKIYVAGDVQVIEEAGIKTYRIGTVDIKDDGTFDVEKAKEFLLQSEAAKQAFGQSAMSESELDKYYEMSNLTASSMFYNIYKSFGIPLPPNVEQMNWLDNQSVEKIDAPKKL